MHSSDTRKKFDFNEFFAKVKKILLQIITHSKTKKIVLYTLLTVFAALMFFPFYWLLISALQRSEDLTTLPPNFFPLRITFNNFITVLQESKLLRYLANSLIVTSISVVCTLFVTILAAFALTKLKVPGRTIIIAIMLTLIILPSELLIVTNYSTIIQLGLQDNLAALILPFVGSVYYVLILRNSFLVSSDKIYAAARIDGASNWRYLWRVLVPQSKPTIIAIVLFNALASWNSFLWPMLVIKTDENKTLPFGLLTFVGDDDRMKIELTMAASLIALIPMLILFLTTRKFLIKAISRGGSKG
ncbi:MAG: carbohydrate ABC transporter permease [Clostridiales bacterium]|jgi:multiple sugar transport system permease protein|nr:carbohydrate ABC transporter permease [Clostridiales bacterium]